MLKSASARPTRVYKKNARPEDVEDMLREIGAHPEQRKSREEDESDAPNPFSLRAKLVPKDVTFGSAIVKKTAKPKRTKIIKVLHPPTGSIHRIQTSSGITKDFHDALVRGGYVHSRPDVWASMLDSASHQGRGIHIVHKNGFFVDGEHVNRDGSRPVPPGARFGAAKGDSDVSVERNGKLVKNPSAAERALAAE